MKNATNMNNVDVLIVVDTLEAATSGNLQDNVYLVDTNKYMGSGHEGQAELQTACQDGQIVKWRVAAIDPSQSVDIKAFTGQIINEKVCVPSEQGIPGDKYWEGRVESRGATQSYQYSVKLNINNKTMTFDPFLNVK